MSLYQIFPSFFQLGVSQKVAQSLRRPVERSPSRLFLLFPVSPCPRVHITPPSLNPPSPWIPGLRCAPPGMTKRESPVTNAPQVSDLSPTLRYQACHAKGVITPIQFFPRVPVSPRPRVCSESRHWRDRGMDRVLFGRHLAFRVEVFISF